MLQNIDIERAARHMIAKRGEFAEGHAEKRVDDLAREGNRDAYLIWRLITKRIKTIRSESVTIEACQATQTSRGRFTFIDGGRS